MTINRRQFVAGASAAIGVAGLGTTVGADSATPVEIVEVFPVADVVILENTGEEAVELGDAIMDWEYGSDPNQTDSFPDDASIEPGETLSVWSGFQSTQIPDVEADIQLGDYGNGRINASEPDIVALLSGSGDVIDQTDATVDDGHSYEDYLDEVSIEGNVTIDVTTRIKDGYDEDRECEEAEEPHNIDTIEIEEATPSIISGFVELRQSNTSQEYDVEISLNDSLTGSVLLELSCIEEATAEFTIEPEEPLPSGDYELEVSVIHLHQDWANEDKEPFQITGDPDDPGEPDDDEWADDFRDSETGSEPDGWSSPTGSDFEVVNSSGRVGNAEVELASGESAAHLLEWDEAAEFEDGEIAAIYDAATRTGNGHRLFLRTQNDGDDAYFLEPRPDTNELMIRRYAGGGLSTLETASKTLDETDGQLQARFRVEGDALKGKAWNSGDDEPDDWDIETASTDVEGVGTPAIGTFNGPGERWSAVAAATGDETAPLPEIDDGDDEGGTVDRPTDTRQVLNQTGPSGVRVVVEEDLSGLELTISEDTTGVDTAEIANAVGSTLETRNISDLGPGDSFEIEYDLEAGEEYIVLLYADDSYDRGDYGEPEWPYDGEQFQVVEGIWGRDNSTANHFYAYTKLTALL